MAGLLAVCAGVTERISISDIPVQNPSEAVHEGLSEGEEAAAPSDSSSSSSSATAEFQPRESSGRSQESRLQPHVVEVEEAVADNAVQADDTEGAESSGATLKVVPHAPLAAAYLPESLACRTTTKHAIYTAIL